VLISKIHCCGLWLHGLYNITQQNRVGLLLWFRELYNLPLKIFSREDSSFFSICIYMLCVCAWSRCVFALGLCYAEAVQQQSTHQRNGPDNNAQSTSTHVTMRV